MWTFLQHLICSRRFKNAIENTIFSFAVWIEGLKKNERFMFHFSSCRNKIKWENTIADAVVEKINIFITEWLMFVLKCEPRRQIRQRVTEGDWCVCSQIINVGIFLRNRQKEASGEDSLPDVIIEISSGYRVGWHYRDMPKQRIGCTMMFWCYKVCLYFQK